MRTGTAAVVPSEDLSAARDPGSLEWLGSKGSFTRFNCLLIGGSGPIGVPGTPGTMIIATLSGARNDADPAPPRAFWDIAHTRRI
ncbi:hypothetical protein GCM10010523_08600 [Paenarthrobacter ilicis]